MTRASNFKLKAFKMSPLVGIFVITLLSSILYNKFDANSRATTQKNLYYWSDKSNTKMEDLKDESNDFDLEDITEVDVCIFTVVAGNQKLCKEKSDENFDRLALLMLSCHTAGENDKFKKCTAEKKFEDCTSSLNTIDLESLESVKKRATTVCQEVSQQLFMINSQRRSQALLETAQLHSSVMTSFKDNQKLLEEITSQTLSRLRVQRAAFMKDMSLFKKYFTKNESLFAEAARAHIALLSKHKRIVGGLEKDVNILTEGFLQTLETMQDNFTTFSVKIFAKHNEMMTNLNRVENTADKILRQLEMIEEYDYSITLKNVFNSVMAQLWRYREAACAVLTLSLVVYGMLLLTKIFAWIKVVLIASVIGGVLLRYEYVSLLIPLWFISILSEISIWCFSFLSNGRGETVDRGVNTSMELNSVSVMNENETEETTCETGTTGDSSGKDCNSERDNMGSRSTSIIVPKNASIQGMDTVQTSCVAATNRNNLYPARRDGNDIQQGTIADCETKDSGAIMDVEVHPFSGIKAKSTARLDIQEQNRVSTRQYESIEIQGISESKNVQTSTICDSEVQTGPGNDIAIQTNVQCHSEVQTGPSEDTSVQTSTTDEHSVQTHTDKVVAVQTSTEDDSEVQTDSNVIDIALQTCAQIDRKTQESTGNYMATQTSSEVHKRITGDSAVVAGTRGVMIVQRDDHRVLTGGTNAETNNTDILMSLRYGNHAATDTNNTAGERRTICDTLRQTGATNDQTGQTGENMVLERKTSSVAGVHTRSRGDSNLEMVTRGDIRLQPRILVEDTSQGQLEITDDFGVPNEPLGTQEDTMSMPRQSGIILNIGDNFGVSRRQTSSPRGQSRSSSPFEVIRRSSGTTEDAGTGSAMDNNRLRGISEDISDEAGTFGEFRSITVGVQINRGDDDRRECGLMTLQGMPCKRRVSSGRCPIHRK